MRERYDFSFFLHRLCDLDYSEMIREAEREGDLVESLSYKTKGAQERRASGSVQYVQKIGTLLFFLRYGRKPDGATDEEFQLYKPLCEKLVLKGQLLPTILDFFIPAGQAR